MRAVEILTRSLARRLRIIDILQRFRSLRASGGAGDSAYEETFGRCLREAIGPGDVVWDIGANVGLYTTRFGKWAGESGSVCAFEPTPRCFAALERAVADRALSNCQLFNYAIGRSRSEVRMLLDDDPLAEIHRVTDAPADGKTITVPMRAVDELIAEDGLPAPTVVKIDVEGYEDEVLGGMMRLLENGTCGSIFIEVHFGLLEDRGRMFAPLQIERQLKAAGYRVTWIDSSHLSARRPS